MLWTATQIVRRRRLCAPAELRLARQRARVAQRDRRLAAAVRRPGDQGGQASDRDWRGRPSGHARRAAGGGPARAGSRRIAEDGRGRLHSPGARASCRQPDADRQPPRHCQKHALRKDSQVQARRRGERRAQTRRVGPGAKPGRR
nr:hypothetical protein [Burkholderia sp. lig30]